MNKCMAADKPCTCQPTAGNVCADVIALRKYAEFYRHLRDKSKTRLRVWRPEDDGGATGPFYSTHLDAEIEAEIARASAVGAA